MPPHAAEADEHTTGDVEEPSSGAAHLARDLKPGVAHGTTLQHIASCSALGLVLSTNAEQEVVFVRALPNSPAARLPQGRVAKHDVLVAIDDAIVYKMPLKAVMKLLSAPCSSHDDAGVCTLHFHRGSSGDCTQTITEALENGTLNRLGPCHTASLMCVPYMLSLTFCVIRTQELCDAHSR
jgi:hypothetical protein